MGNEKRSGLLGNGLERRTSALDCDVGLGLKMQVQQPNDKSSMVWPPYSFQLTSSENSTGLGGDGGGGSIFCNTSNLQVAGGVDVYEAADPSLSSAAVLSKTASVAGGGIIPVSGKSLFTASQWQELERQNEINKYMMSSIPVPPQLLLPAMSKYSSLAPFSQSSTSVLDARLSSNGSDPEPWRCKRTDGKKWRCSRDVTPDQKYCERHAHKSRPRSRKHVEIQAHNNNYSHMVPANASISSTSQPPQRPTSQFPSMPSSTTSYVHQPRNIECFMKGSSSSAMPVSTCNQLQWQQVMQTSSNLGREKDNVDHNKGMSFSQPKDQDAQAFNLHPYIPERLENGQQLNIGQTWNSIFHPKMASLQGFSTPLGADKPQATRHFIDAWSRSDKESTHGISIEGSTSLNKRFSASSLSLTMSAGNGIDEDNNVNADMGIDRGSIGVLKSQWMNPISWMNSPPGGPLGEALCLGNTSTTSGNSNSNFAFPHGCYGSSNAFAHGYSNSNGNSS